MTGAAASPSRDAPPEAARRAFIRANTAARTVPLCPEIDLHVADEAFGLWHRSEEELGRMGVPMPFWAFAWAGGQALARYVLDTPDAVAGRRVLDLGTGSGLVAIAAAKAGAHEVTAVDPDPWAGEAARVNAALNAVALRTRVADILDDDVPPVGTILVGDLHYDREVAPRLTAFLARARAGGAEVLIGDPGRAYLPKTGLRRLAQYRVPTAHALEDTEIKHSSVWRLVAA